MKKPGLGGLGLAIILTASAAPLEFHVRPNGVAPFSDASSTNRPSLNQPGRPAWNTSGISANYWLADGGSAEHPFATLFQAQLAVRELRRTQSLPAEGVRVIIHGGTYFLDEPLEFFPDDSGTPTQPIVYAAAPGEKPVLSGGLSVTGWKRLDHPVPGLPDVATNHVWYAPVPQVGAQALDFRQLYVNDQKAERARTPNAESYHRLTRWDIANRQVCVSTQEVANWHQLERVEMVLQTSWTISYLRLATIATEGDQARITFQNPERNLVFSHPFPWARHTDPYHFVNAVEFLDTPGEWYLDHKAGEIYYWPRPGEDLTTESVIAPRLETLLRFTGSADQPVHDIQFQGLTFTDTTWLRPTLQGHVPLQAGQFFERAGYRIQGGTPAAPKLENLAWTARPPGAVYLAGASRIGFELCHFRNTASAALDLHHHTQSNWVAGCTFIGIGGNGVQIGKFSEDGLEAHEPYTVSDERELARNDRVENGYFRDCANEDWGCVGIAAGYPRGLVIEHNELVDLPYSGISLGWGWTAHTNAMQDNVIRYNRIRRYMQRLGDGGGIYLLSRQPGTEVRGNLLYDLRRSPVGDAGFMLYLDEGSSDFVVRDNYTEQDRQNRNANGPGIQWENNGPNAAFNLAELPGARGVIGIEPRYRERLLSEMAEVDRPTAELPTGITNAPTGKKTPRP